MAQKTHVQCYMARHGEQQKRWDLSNFTPTRFRKRVAQVYAQLGGVLLGRRAAVTGTVNPGQELTQNTNNKNLNGAQNVEVSDAYMDFMAILDWDHSEDDVQGDLFADEQEPD
jgi:hypothetical protein